MLATQPSQSLRIVILGSAKCGKSAVTVRYLTKRFIGEYSSSKDFLYHQTLQCDGQTTKVEILDTSGCKSAQCLQEHILWAHSYVIVYSICDRKSFQQAKRLVECVCRIKRALKNNAKSSLSSSSSFSSSSSSSSSSPQHQTAIRHSFSSSTPTHVDNSSSTFSGPTSLTSECDRLRFLLRQVQQNQQQPTGLLLPHTPGSRTSGSSCCSSLAPSDEEEDEQQPWPTAGRPNQSTAIHQSMASYEGEHRRRQQLLFQADQQLLPVSTGQQTSDCESSQLPVILLGNKRDLEHVRQVMVEDGQEFALLWRCQFYEVSAAESFVGVRLAFQGLVREARASSLLLHDPAVHSAMSPAMSAVTATGQPATCHLLPHHHHHHHSHNQQSNPVHPQPESGLSTCCTVVADGHHHTCDRHSCPLNSCCTATTNSAGLKSVHQLLPLNMRRKSGSTMSVSKMIGIVFGSKSARQKKRPSLSI